MATNKKIAKLKIKKNNIVVTVFLFLLITVCLIGLVLLSLVFFLKFAIDSNLYDEFDRVKSMISTYENAYLSVREARLTAFGSDFFITDSKGQLLFLHGKDTCDSKDGELFADWEDSSESYKVYLDTESSVFLPGGGRLSLDYTEFFSTVRSQLRSGLTLEKFFSVGRSDIFEPSHIEMPVWISSAMSGGKELYVKSAISVDLNSLFTVIQVSGLMLLVCIVIFLILLIMAVRNAVAQRRLTKLFFTDTVTGSSNKSWFLIKGERKLRSFFSRKKNYAVFSVSVVRYLNYCICHSITDGEKLLCSVNGAIWRLINKQDFCVHYDSNDFAILTQVTDEEGMRDFARKLMETLSATAPVKFQIGAFYAPVRVSESGRIIRRKNIDLEECFNNARTARETLALSDDSGIAFFDQKLIEDQKWENTVTEMQQRALENEEFAVYYQPKYDPRTDTLRGAEALIRWNSPEYGFLTPYRFIPIFEKNRFITEIDHYMISHVARDQKRWLDAGLKCVPVSVNVSRIHFAEADLAEQIRDLVDKEGTPRELIEIELTESAFFDDKSAMLRTISKLKEYGFDVSMDDFGSGYSSLNSLKDMPLDVLKLDAEFFRGENADERGRIIVSEAIKLAQSLHMKTVAEGVEVKEQVEFLAEQECDMIQGYYYAKPMPEEEFEERLGKQE